MSTDSKGTVVSSVGGQALMEGILMRGPKKSAIALRLPDKSIYVEELKTEFLRDKYRILGLPLLRGIGSLIDSLKIGHKAMKLSLEKTLKENNKNEKINDTVKLERYLSRVFGKRGTNLVLNLVSVLGILFSVFIFLFLPSWISNFFAPSFPAVDNVVCRSFFEGIIKFFVFLLYLIGISKLKDIRRIFKYHGAEHKAIFCYENSEDLTVSNVKKFGRFHPRCGTSFLIIMVIVGIFFGVFIPFVNPVARSLVRLLCLPLFASIGFELIRYCSRHSNLLARILSKPGLLLQKISTQEPDDEIIEVAIAAIKRVIPGNDEDQHATA